MSFELSVTSFCADCHLFLIYLTPFCKANILYSFYSWFLNKIWFYLLFDIVCNNWVFFMGICKNQCNLVKVVIVESDNKMFLKWWITCKTSIGCSMARHVRDGAAGCGSVAGLSRSSGFQAPDHSPAHLNRWPTYFPSYTSTCLSSKYES